MKTLLIALALLLATSAQADTSCPSCWPWPGESWRVIGIVIELDPDAPHYREPLYLVMCHDWRVWPTYDLDTFACPVRRRAVAPQTPRPPNEHRKPDYP